MKDAAINKKKAGQDVLAALEEFEKVQQAHAKKLKAGKLKGITAWRTERNQSMARLLQCLDIFKSAAASQSDADFVEKLLERLRALLAGETELLGRVVRQRSLLGDKLGAIRKGRKTLKNYGMNRAGHKPRVLSSRT